MTKVTIYTDNNKSNSNDIISDNIASESENKRRRTHYISLNFCSNWRGGSDSGALSQHECRQSSRRASRAGRKRDNVAAAAVAAAAVIFIITGR